MLSLVVKKRIAAFLCQSYVCAKVVALGDGTLDVRSGSGSDVTDVNINAGIWLHDGCSELLKFLALFLSGSSQFV